MADDTAKMEESKGRRKRGLCCGGCLGVVALCLLLSHLFFTSVREKYEAEIEKEIAAIRAEGYPTNGKELDEYYTHVSPEENAAVIYQQAFDVYVEPGEDPIPGTENIGNDDEDDGDDDDGGDDDAELEERELKSEYDLLPIVGTAESPEPGKPLPPEMKKTIEGFLKKNAECLRLLHEAAKFEKCRYPVNFAGNLGDLVDLYSISFEHLQGMRYCARLLSLEMMLATDNSDGTRAARAMSDAMMLSSSLKNEPILIAVLVGIAVQAIANSRFEESLSSAFLSAAELDVIENTIRNLDFKNCLFRGYAGERVLIESAMRMPIEKITFYGFLGTGDQYLQNRTFVRMYKYAGLFVDDISFILLSYRKLVDISKMTNSTKRLKAMDDFEKALSDSLKPNMLGIRMPKRLIFRNTMPFLSRAILSETKSEAMQSHTLLAIAIEKFRLKNGTLPGKLAELVPGYIEEIPLDPFDGKAMRYKLLPKGYLVYSVGEDGVDDGGDDSAKKRNEPDIVFRVLR